MSSVFMYAESGDEIHVQQPRTPHAFTRYEVRIGESAYLMLQTRELGEQLHAALGEALAEPDEGGA